MFIMRAYTTSKVRASVCRESVAKPCPQLLKTSTCVLNYCSWLVFFLETSLDGAGPTICRHFKFQKWSVCFLFQQKIFCQRGHRRC